MTPNDPPLPDDGPSRGTGTPEDWRRALQLLDALLALEPAALEAALAATATNRDDAVVAFADGFTMGFAGRFAEFSLAQRIPVVDGWAPFARAGNVLIYGPVQSEVYRRLAAYVDKIRKGAKPGELPVELPSKTELIVNARTAKAIGMAIPASLLARADEVIQ